MNPALHRELKAVAPAARRFLIFVAAIIGAAILWAAWMTQGFTDWPNSWERWNVWFWSYQEQHQIEQAPMMRILAPQQP